MKVSKQSSAASKKDVESDAPNSKSGSQHDS